MNSYTFSSKKTFKRFALVAVLVFIAANLVLDIGLDFYVKKKTGKSSFLDDKISKAKHMALQDQNKTLDYIFIGSSDTLYHISTNEFKKYNLNIYNYGSSDRALNDFPYMIKQALKLKPKNIIISLRLPAFSGGFGNFKQITINDFYYIYKYQDFNTLIEALLHYIKNMHLLLRHSEAMNIRLDQVYQKFNPYPATDKKKIENISKTKIIDLKREIDCDVFDYNQITNSKTIAKCTNGDGIIIGNTIKNKSREGLSKINIEYVNMLNALLDMIQKEGVEPIIVLLPLRSTISKERSQEVINKLHCKVINLSEQNIQDNYWSDNKHLNANGRIFYSDILIKMLKNETSEN